MAKCNQLTPVSFKGLIGRRRRKGQKEKKEQDEEIAEETAEGQEDDTVCGGYVINACK